MAGFQLLRHLCKLIDDIFDILPVLTGQAQISQVVPRVLNAVQDFFSALSR